MKRRLNSALMILLLSFMSQVFPGAVHAQSQSDASDEELVIDKQRIPDAPNSRRQEQSKSNNESSEQVYKPTEEISEDQPVAFPIDI